MKVLISVSRAISRENQQANISKGEESQQTLQVLIPTVCHVQSITEYFAIGLIMFQSATGKNKQSYDPFSGISATTRLTV